MNTLRRLWRAFVDAEVRFNRALPPGVPRSWLARYAERHDEPKTTQSEA
jgi:hypothetical protein